jgi:hypothetical protein
LSPRDDVREDVMVELPCLAGCVGGQF